MKLTRPRLLTSALLAGLGMAAPMTGYADNPIVSHVYTADPAARVIDGRVYVMVTHDQDDQSDYSQLVDYYLFSSDDMVNWQDHGIVWNSQTDSPWASLAYAPDFIERNGRYYLYYPDGANAIGVAVADNPEGPYTDPLGEPLVDRSTPGANVDWVFDPGVFIDDNGQAYLYFGGGGPGNARVIRLNNDMISTDGVATSIDAPNFFEALYMNKRNGTYYLTYSTDTAGGLSIDYMTSNNPTSGFTHRGTILPNPWENNNNNNHQSMVQFDGQWYMFYHNRAVANERGASTYQRSINVDRLYFNGDGSIQPVNAGPAGVPQLEYVDAFAINQAETFDTENGIETEPASEGTQNIQMGPGDWVRITGVDFGSGANGMDARVAANIDSSLEIVLDDVNSQPLATLQVSNTGGWQTWQTQSVSFSEVTGVHDVYLRSTAGHNLNWFQFTGGSGNDSSSSENSSSSSAVSSSDGNTDSNVTGSIQFTNDWGSGYCATLTVTNNTGSAVEWNLNIAVEGTVTDLWNGEWSQNGSTLQVSGAGWNSTLQPGQSDSNIGFCAERTAPPTSSSSSSSSQSSSDQSSSAPDGNGDELASNGGVESGLTNWSTTAGDINRSTQDSRSGSASALISGRTDTWHGLTFAPNGLASGNQYDVSVWVKMAPGSASANLYLTAKREEDSDSSTYEEYTRVAEASVSASGWTQLSGSYTQSGTPFQHFIIESDSTNASYYADDFSVIGEAGDGGDGGNGGTIDHDFFVGNITTSGSVRSDFVQYWDQITPENEGKWSSVEGTRDQYNWSGVDAAYNYAQQNNIAFKQHTFVWGNQSPSWINNLSPAEQRAEIEEWIRDFCTRYPNTEMIDVVNESTPGHAPAQYAEQAFGSDWIINVFELAQEHCPNSILILNDYNALSWNNSEFIEMARPAVEAGVVDALGLQAHGLEGWSLSDLRTNLDNIAALGLPIYISEYDIAESNDQAQLQIMQEQFPMFYEHPSVVGITLWGYVVGRTWVDGSGLIYDNGTPRPAMTWLMNYLGR
ncbi:endo-1,4-beta-xylanase [Marinimicrobium agarilyticum]|uniref:endo-1,4-beta-xylanase n=1 Tax=Marinimicrobium agarilyticum TaxID=306546 RepID=UPI000A0540E8|nr:endo-1,4-beta-xylanase [Marinimicrobium agarilyticum]